MTATQVLRDRAAPVSTVRTEARVAELFRHQRVPQIAEAEQPALAFACLRESVARQAWYHDIEGISRVGTMRCRVGEQWDQLVEPPEGVGKAVSEDQRQRLRSASLLMNEVQPRPIDLCLKVIEAIQQSLLCAPVEVIAPILQKLTKIGGIRAGAPIVGLTRRQASGTQPRREVIQQLVRHCNAKWLGHG